MLLQQIWFLKNWLDRRIGRWRADSEMTPRFQDWESGFTRDKMGKSAEEAYFVEEELGSGHMLKMK